MNSAIPAATAAAPRGRTTPAAGSRGRTTIRPRVVEKLAQVAVREPGHWWYDAVTGVRARGVVDGAYAALRLEVHVVHPTPARSLGADVRQHVTTRTYELTGLTVWQLEVTVVPVAPPAPTKVK